MIPLDSFVGQSADGKMVPIIPGGNSIPLTFSNRKEYVERAIEYRLHEMDRQVCSTRLSIVSKPVYPFLEYVGVYPHLDNDLSSDPVIHLFCCVHL